MLTFLTACFPDGKQVKFLFLMKNGVVLFSIPLSENLLLMQFILRHRECVELRPICAASENYLPIHSVCSHTVFQKDYTNQHVSNLLGTHLRCQVATGTVPSGLPTLRHQTMLELAKMSNAIAFIHLCCLHIAA